MVRLILCLFVLCAGELVSAQATSAPTTEEVAQAQKNFNESYETLFKLNQQIGAKWRDSQSTSGHERDALLAEVNELKKDIESLNEKLITASLVLYQNNPENKQVYDILRVTAEFLVVGDPQGNGGDQYEKALPIIRAMIDAGAATEVKEFWLWGGAAAYCTSNFDLAKAYLGQAKAAGFFEGLPARPSDNPRILVKQRGASYLDELPTLRRDWAKEQEIRQAEATADNLPRVKMTTTKGDIVIELFENEAPQAVANIITLVKQGYYDGIVFHRVLPQFMAQGGDPTGTGSGGPGYNIRCECYGANIRKHFRGSLSMAHAGRNTGGSQFFLTYVPTSYLDGRHTVFGRVVEGIDVASSLKRRNPQSRNAPEPDKIIKATVLRDRGHGYEFEKLPLTTIVCCLTRRCKDAEIHAEDLNPQRNEETKIIETGSTG